MRFSSRGFFVRKLTGFRAKFMSPERRSHMINFLGSSNKCSAIYYKDI